MGQPLRVIIAMEPVSTILRDQLSRWTDLTSNSNAHAICEWLTGRSDREWEAEPFPTTRHKGSATTLRFSSSRLMALLLPNRSASL